MPDLPELPKFFPTDRSKPCYAVYGTAVDRFLLVDRYDLSILLKAAMLFSSKMVTVVCVYDAPTNPVLSNETCTAWAPVHRLSQAMSRIPTVLRLDGPNAIVEKGGVPFVAADALADAQRYLEFVTRVLYAQFMTTARLGHADVRIFRSMIPEFETLPGAPLSQAPQLFPGQVRDQRIEEILYYADTVEQAMSELDALLAKRGDGKVGISPYYTVFNQYLGLPTFVS
jgi:hypothetical protein